MYLLLDISSFLTLLSSTRLAWIHTVDSCAIHLRHRPNREQPGLRLGGGVVGEQASLQVLAGGGRDKPEEPVVQVSLWVGS